MTPIANIQSQATLDQAIGILRRSVIDWNGATMADGEQPLDIIRCEHVRLVLAELDRRNQRTITVGEYTLRPLGLGQPGVSVMHASGEGGTFTRDQFNEAMAHLWRHF